MGLKLLELDVMHKAICFLFFEKQTVYCDDWVAHESMAWMSLGPNPVYFGYIYQF
jgi:hypothetical protein